MRLPAQLYSPQIPTPVATPGSIRVNTALAEQLGIDVQWLESDSGIATVAGNAIPAGSEPLAMAYAGHQFGSWNPQLGDGRAILLGEVVGKDDRRYDLQLKGAGRTPYSRGGDGRSPLGPVLREYIVSEAMAALGVPTTRALAAVTTGEIVYREEALPGAVLARVASSHIRIGSFQFFYARKDNEALQALLDTVIQRHYPAAADADKPAAAMLDAVIQAQAELVAHWQSLGFIHGVMNTDNMLLCGETIDYGPCAFMDVFHPETVFSSIDQNGRYAYQNQPAITHWNLSQLAQALVPLLHEDAEQSVELAQEAINSFPSRFVAAYQSRMNKKLGLAQTQDGDEKLLQELLTVMTETKADFTLSFRHLADRCAIANEHQAVDALVELGDAFDPWLERWRARLAQDPQTPRQREQQMVAANPAFIPRNHLVEEALTTATQDQDFTAFNTLVETLATPFTYRNEFKQLATPPRPEQVVHKTFCGT